MPASQDSYTKNGAGVLAAIVEKHWNGLVKAERYEIPQMPGLWGVRSSLVNGLPRGHVWRKGVGAVPK